MGRGQGQGVSKGTIRERIGWLEYRAHFEALSVTTLKNTSARTIVAMPSTMVALPSSANDAADAPRAQEPTTAARAAPTICAMMSRRGSAQVSKRPFLAKRATVMAGLKAAKPLIHTHVARVVPMANAEPSEPDVEMPAMPRKRKKVATASPPRGALRAKP